MNILPQTSHTSNKKALPEIFSSRVRKEIRLRRNFLYYKKDEEKRMNQSFKLPITADKDCFEIRLESIGGLGANLCGKMLGELGALYLKLNASNFSSYGSEKRGSPVKAFIRWCAPEKELRINTPVEKPDILAIFHEALLGKCPVLAGITSTSKIILNTPLSVNEAAEKYQIPTGQLYCLDALSLAMESKSRINMVMLGAVARLSGEVPFSLLEKLCRETVGKKYPAMIEANLQGLKLGYERITADCLDLSTTKESSCGKSADKKQDDNAPESFNQYVWGYRNAPIGGVNPRIGSTVSNDLTPSREGYIPLFIQDRCINCGLCDSTCPDMVFQFKPGIYKGKECMVNSGLDYYHCKGCLRCVEVCPTDALVKALEKDYPNKPWLLPNQDLLPDAIQYEETGPSSYITSDSYLTEKRVDGGLV